MLLLILDRHRHALNRKCKLQSQVRFSTPGTTKFCKVGL
ncbi:hypothetical protein M8C21_028190 [Ambrosia artemisiifolia]|uniref:Uncharacterized protein n=1 Tax=Ambrosia artemisiifolia TaxID=4212 RepID=A0AAD5GWE8_AMBAR|nr:hypothetical protein M8C21_028190 [Ambrosia artemisiifolia]